MMSGMKTEDLIQQFWISHPYY